MRRFGLIGSPLTHSFSERYFADRFAREHISDCRYDNYQIEDLGDQGALLRAALPSDIQGFNVTIPHKQTIIPLLASIEAEAESVGAVNCVKVTSQGCYRGYNTDVYGFEGALLGMLGPANRPEAMVLGTGGAAKAVCHVLTKLGMSYISVSRTPASDAALSYEALTPAVLQQHRLIVNTTPRGMYPHTDASPLLPYDSIGQGHYLFDLIYNPAETLFLKQGRRRGAVVKNGLEMLILQAERSWDIWNETL